MTKPEMSWDEARQQVRRIVDQLEAVHWQLLGVNLSLLKPPAEDSQEDLSSEPDASRDLRTTLECVLADDIRPALEDLRALLPAG